MYYISLFVNARYVQNDFELNKFSSRARKNSVLITLYIIAALPYRSLICCASEFHDLSRTQIQRFDKQIDMFGCPISLRAGDKRLLNDAQTRDGEEGRGAFFFDTMESAPGTALCPISSIYDAYVHIAVIK